MTAGKKFKRLVRDRAKRTGESYASARRQLLPPSSEGTMTSDRLVEVRPVRVAASMPEKVPFLMLREVAGGRTLPIAIGPAEANAIEFALQGVPMKRPMTHDAFKQAVDALGARIRRIVVGFQPDEHMYTAEVVLEVGEEERRLDWRVSDSVALAVRCEPPPPILVPESLFETTASPSRHPSGWPRRIQVRCACGAWIVVEEFESADPAAAEVELDLTCAACGAHQHARIRRPLP